jgi:hypothetical protein
VEANLEVREPDPNADPSTLQGQRQILLRHGTWSVWFILPRLLDVCLENIRLLRGPPHSAEEKTEEREFEGKNSEEIS